MKTYTVVVGKWHVVDMLTHGPSGIIAGPFDTRAQAETDRRGMNIAEDCVSALAYMADNGRIRLDPNG